MHKPEVRVKELGKQIKNQLLVDDISFELEAGHVLAVCGGNGAGKSTLLRMLAGILRPTSGEIRVNNLRWAQDRKRYADQIGYMPDDYQFSQGLTAEETLLFWASLRKLPKQRVQEVLEMVGLDKQKHKRVTTFSKGMRQRILFAQAMLAKPALLIMDEPTNGLDPFWMQEFVHLLSEIKQVGHMVVFSTHQLEVANDIADQVLFMNQGRNVGEGTTTAIREQYGSLHAAFHQSLGLK
ncbi:heme ABC exporter ATP-binding protein CcmA [Paenibacillus barcinonensis]|uniref:Heme ABC exporter ATP-binding protein CcmA n=1 Tax=Paenibacillus barcinonensis TaxID=198119 RepID=A0A2V4VIJ6_PAEBA|nr:heme ABC exporter ATP-binding protein CcmA [Paenibacillus barcinonensis]PYE42138.1 heme ABC exporter ATP-binding subunit CcmA [Paenibacillus barcinonensis]QKS55059.1 heme ABC exporter ATP-binding protein CcmA [Paenibacillus barcinonensis]